MLASYTPTSSVISMLLSGDFNVTVAVTVYLSVSASYATLAFTSECTTPSS